MTSRRRRSPPGLIASRREYPSIPACGPLTRSPRRAPLARCDPSRYRRLGRWAGWWGRRVGVSPSGGRVVMTLAFEGTAVPTRWAGRRRGWCAASRCCPAHSVPGGGRSSGGSASSPRKWSQILASTGARVRTTGNPSREAALRFFMTSPQGAYRRRRRCPRTRARSWTGLGLGRCTALDREGGVGWTVLLDALWDARDGCRSTEPVAVRSRHRRCRRAKSSAPM
jgi:hypothetical protein